MKKIIAMVKSELEKNDLLKDCNEYSVLELLDSKTLDKIEKWAVEKYILTDAEYRTLTNSLYGSYSWCSSKDEVIWQMVLDVIDLNMIGKEVTYTQIKRESIKESR